MLIRLKARKTLTEIDSAGFCGQARHDSEYIGAYLREWGTDLHDWIKRKIKAKDGHPYFLPEVFCLPSLLRVISVRRVIVLIKSTFLNRSALQSSSIETRVTGSNP